MCEQSLLSESSDALAPGRGRETYEESMDV
jgi:hypothetical protein